MAEEIKINKEREREREREKEEIEEEKVKNYVILLIHLYGAQRDK